MSDVVHEHPSSGLPVLDAAEQRVLGSLLEKEVTVPSTYPMTVNSVRTACNQTSSREPVVAYEERFVQDTLRGLKDKDLVAVTWSDTGKRTMKYLQKLSARLDLANDQRAVLTVLLLRGAQAPGALKVRTERLHPFLDRGAVEATLADLAALEPPLVTELPRRPREQDNRWIHLLGPVDLPETPAPGGGGAAAPTVDREQPLTDGGAEARDDRVRAGYGAVAADYAEALTAELDVLPFERWVLTRVAEEADGGPVVEVGCGPGHVTAFLAAAGAEATGIDLTPEMVEEARRRYPDGTYEVGDLRRLMKPPAADGWSAVLGWYSLIHLAGSELADAVAALVRTLRPGGRLVLGLHAGSEVRRMQEWFGHDVDLQFVMHEPAAVVAVLEAAGLVDVEWYRRGPVASRGETTQRLVVLGTLPI